MAPYRPAALAVGATTLLSSGGRKDHERMPSALSMGHSSASTTRVWWLLIPPSSPPRTSKILPETKRARAAGQRFDLIVPDFPLGPVAGCGYRPAMTNRRHAPHIRVVVHLGQRPVGDPPCSNYKNYNP